MNRWVALICSTVVVAAVLMGSPACAQSSYAFRDLGTLGGRYSCARGVNKYGNVVGESWWFASANTFNRDEHAFYWNRSTGKMQDLGALPGGVTSLAYALNNFEEVVGRAAVDANAQTYHAFYWTTAGGMVDLNGLLFPTDQANWTLAFAYDINDNHVVVGSGYVLVGGVPTRHGFLFDLTTHALTDIGTLYDPANTSAVSDAFAVNANGWAVGSSTIAGSGVIPGILYPGGLPLIDLSPMGTARGTNDSGAIVGSTGSGSSGRACYRAPDGTLYSLGSLGGASTAYRINNAAKATAVGWSIGKGNYGASDHAFRWQVGDAAMTDLNNLISKRGKYQIKYAYAVSDSGYIVGAANANSPYYASPDDHAFLLTPQ